MLLILLLQAANSGLSITAYLTFGASILAVLASINATIVSSRTQRHVAAQAAQTARDSAKIAADTAREIKNQDYKFDFYKKIIEKRLAAWADAEQTLMPLMTSVIVDEKDNRKRLFFFKGPERFAAMLDLVNKSLVGQTFWIGGRYAEGLLEFRTYLLEISHQCHVIGRYTPEGTPLVNQALLYEAGAVYHEQLRNIHLGMTSALLRQLTTLHDVDTFLQNCVID